MSEDTQPGQNAWNALFVLIFDKVVTVSEAMCYASVADWVFFIMSCLGYPSS